MKPHKYEILVDKSRVVFFFRLVSFFSPRHEPLDSFHVDRRNKPSYSSLRGSPLKPISMKEVKTVRNKDKEYKNK